MASSHLFRVVAMSVALALSMRSTAVAQGAPEHGWLEINVGVPWASDDPLTMADSRIQTQSGQVSTRDLRVEFPLRNGRTLDIGAGLMLTRFLAVSVGFTETTYGSPARLSVHETNMWFEGADVDGSSITDGDFQREESALHLGGVFVVPLSEHVLGKAFAGPTLMRVRQDLADYVTGSYVTSFVAGQGYAVRFMDSNINRCKDTPTRGAITPGDRSQCS